MASSTGGVRWGRGIPVLMMALVLVATGCSKNRNDAAAGAGVRAYDIFAQKFRYNGVPASIPSGNIQLNFSNRESFPIVHEMILARCPPVRPRTTSSRAPRSRAASAAARARASTCTSERSTTSRPTPRSPRCSTCRRATTSSPAGSRARPRVRTTVLRTPPSGWCRRSPSPSSHAGLATGRAHRGPRAADPVRDRMCAGRRRRGGPEGAQPVRLHHVDRGARVRDRGVPARLLRVPLPQA